jgi:hypothetical protein
MKTGSTRKRFASGSGRASIGFRVGRRAHSRSLHFRCAPVGACDFFDFRERKGPGTASWEFSAVPVRQAQGRLFGAGSERLSLPRTAPDFLYAALDIVACAAFFTESRMRLILSTNPNRKSGTSRLLSAAPAGLKVPPILAPLEGRKIKTSQALPMTWRVGGLRHPPKPSLQVRSHYLQAAHHFPTGTFRSISLTWLPA